MSAQTSAGIHFPAASGPVGAPSSATGSERPTTPTTRGILADSVAGVDPGLAERIESSTAWRKDYVDHVRAVTERSAASPDDALRIATDGLASMRRRLVLVDEDGGETPLAELDLGRSADGTGHVGPGRGGRFTPFATESVTGTGEAVSELQVPYEGRDLVGEELLAQVQRWVDSGVVEPSVADAVAEVVAHPEWLALPGHRVLLVGAGAEMGPLEPLLSWGVDVHAIDLPRSRAWRYKKGLAAGLAGRLTFPVDASGDSGADLVHQPLEVLDWVRRSAGEEPFVVGMHAYADSGVHVRVSAAADLLLETLRADDPRTAAAWLATPTDAFVVPPEVVTEAHRRWRARGAGLRATQAPARALGRGRLFAPAYRGVVDGQPGIADVLIPQQGPSYALAKRLQRWRGVVGEGSGQRVSFNVAPATWTRSVVKNPVLGAAYAGAHHFGIEVFRPETVRPLMAALLVRDLMGERPDRAHPEELFSDAAAHGGLWRAGYEPKTALGVAAVAGLPSRLAARVRR